MSTYPPDQRSMSYPGGQGPGHPGLPYQPAPPPPSRRGPIIAVVVAVVALLLAAGAVTTFFIINNNGEESPGTTRPPANPGASPSASAAPAGTQTVTMLESRGFECFLPYQEAGATPELHTCYQQVNAEKDFYVALEYKGGGLAYIDSIMIDDPRNPNPQSVRVETEDLFSALIAEMVPEQDVSTVTTWVIDNLESPERAEQTYGDVQLGVRLAEYGYRLQAAYLPLDYTPIEADSLPNLTVDQAKDLFTQGGAECAETECVGQPTSEGHAVGGNLGVLAGDPTKLEILAIDVVTAGGEDIAPVAAEGVRPFLEATMGSSAAAEALEWMAGQYDGTLHAADFAGVHISVHSAPVTEGGTELPAVRVLLSPTTI